MFKLKGVVVHRRIHFEKCSYDLREVVSHLPADFPLNGQCAVCNVIVMFQIQFVKNVPLDVLSECTEYVMDFQVCLEGFVSIC